MDMNDAGKCLEGKLNFNVCTLQLSEGGEKLNDKVHVVESNVVY